MHPEIFNSQQIELLPYMKNFERSFFVGITAIALHIRHHRSIDFDYSKEVKFIVPQVSKEEILNFFFGKATELEL